VRSFRVRLPSGSCYWTVVDGEYRVVGEADEYLRHLRFARDSAESTTAAYATAVALYLTWCQTTGRDWRVGASRLGAFILWLRHVPPGSNQIRLAGAVRGNRRINAVLAAVREFLRYGVTVGSVPAEVLGMLYELGDDRDFPDEFRGEGASVKLLARPRHRLSATTSEVARATDAEAVALLEACRNARDRFLVLLLARAGLRRAKPWRCAAPTCTS
jgi:integrase/recombinase XerD